MTMELDISQKIRDALDAMVGVATRSHIYSPTQIYALKKYDDLRRKEGCRVKALISEEHLRSLNELPAMVELYKWKGDKEVEEAIVKMVKEPY